MRSSLLLKWLPCAVFIFFAPMGAGIEASPRYLVLEGGGRDQGPGPDLEANMRTMGKVFGSLKHDSTRRYAYGVQQMRLLVRSTAYLRAELERTLDFAEETGVPVWLHLDAFYGWGADTEAAPEEAPGIKFWQDPEMREWDRFPEGGVLPTAIPRFWFNWGEWCSPTPAVPALGSPRFMEFSRKQLREGILAPLRSRLERWKQQNRQHLFAGINVGWEIHMPDYTRSIPRQRSGPILARHPSAQQGIIMDPSLPDSRLGYASLHWRGWDEAKLRESAVKEGLSRDAKFQNLIYQVIHDYMEALAQECSVAGLSRDQVYTHIVALASVREANTNHPPIWTAANRFSTPGFTMDQRGAARYDMKSLQQEIVQTPGTMDSSFGVVECYFRLGGTTYATSADGTHEEIRQIFENGAKVQVFFGSFPLEKRMPPEAGEAMKRWLDEE